MSNLSSGIPERKAFTITGGKGFSMRFPNGYTISVQWGPGNYSENHNVNCNYAKAGENHVQGFLDAGEAGSNTAETAVIDGDGEFLNVDSDGVLDASNRSGDVQGWQTTTNVLALMVQVAALPQFVSPPKQLAAPEEPEEVQGELA
jgi:hypothetical protein